MIIRGYPKLKYDKDGNQLPTKRNKKIRKVIKEIEKLKHWKDYVIFERKKYGIPEIFKGIHRKNDCFGYISYRDCCSGGGTRTDCSKCNYVSW